MTSHHMLKNYKVRRGCTVPGLLTWPFSKKSDDTENLEIISSVGGCSNLPVSLSLYLHVYTTLVLSVGVSSPMGAAAERPEFDTKPSLGAPILIFPEVIS